MIDLMIDIETTGTRPGCKILTIAVVPLKESTSPFYERIDSTSWSLTEFSSDTDTLEWWRKQSDKTFREAWTGEVAAEEVLTKFCEYIKSFKEFRVWGNGASFDVPILEYALKAYNIPIPWNYRQSMCFRTVKAMFPNVTYTPQTQAHNALSDATVQAEHLKKILQWIKTSVFVLSVEESFPTR
jgi:DNA polymerase III epsilon subunit-like protein